MFILGVETSCDETSIAVLRNTDVLSNITATSLKKHKKYGGIIPEIASRAHLKVIDKVLIIALQEAGINLSKIDLIATTYRPGLIGSLVVGVNFAKALSFALDKPLIGVDHLKAHLFSPFLNQKKAKIKFPFIGLVVSGGHTEIYRVDDFDKITILGSSLDDACGEVFDKVGRVYGLGYPAGPVIDKLFKEKYKNTFSFKCGRRGCNLSFSGIKTALVYKYQELKKENLLNKKTLIKILSSFQGTVVEAIIAALGEAVNKTGIKRVICGGGVVANSYLRYRLRQQSSFSVLLSPLEYALDNGAMVAGLGYYLYGKGKRSSFKLKAEAN